MAGDSVADGQTFSTKVGLLYVFNLIVGTGALALPRAFQTAGYLLSTLLLLISAFTSYICATFVLESMAIANCVLRRTRASEFDIGDEDLASSVDGEMSEVRVGSIVVTDGNAQHRFSLSAVPTTTTATSSPLPITTLDQQPIRPEDFDITKRIEISEMAQLFLGQGGTLFAYLVLTVYLFGDLAIYSTTVPKSLMNVICSSLNVSTVNASRPCHDQPSDLFHHIDRFAVYRICIVAFILFCLPMILIGMTRTKWLQLTTTLSRWTAFLLMILLATVQLCQNGAKGTPSAVDFHGFGSLSGVAVYAFMCHHSLPGLITPIRNKHHFNTKLTSVYALIYLFYCALSLTGAFAFEHVQDIYTINFLHDDQKGGWLEALVDYFLALFPVFVLSSSYVIVAITLCNNIRVLGKLLTGTTAEEGTDRERLIGLANGAAENDALLRVFPSGTGRSRHSFSAVSSRSATFHRFGIPLLVVALPATISFFTDNVLLLASITGSLPGVGVQFVLPVLLVLGARRSLPPAAPIPSSLRSPFLHWAWPMAILFWASFAVVVVAAHFYQ